MKTNLVGCRRRSKRTGGRRRYAPRGARARPSLDCDRSRVTTGSTPQAAISRKSEIDRSGESRLLERNRIGKRATPTRHSRKRVKGRLVPRSAARIGRQKALGSLARASLGGRGHARAWRDSRGSGHAASSSATAHDDEGVGVRRPGRDGEASETELVERAQDPWFLGPILRASRRASRRSRMAVRPFDPRGSKEQTGTAHESGVRA